MQRLDAALERPLGDQAGEGRDQVRLWPLAHDDEVLAVGVAFDRLPGSDLVDEDLRKRRLGGPPRRRLRGRLLTPLQDHQGLDSVCVAQACPLIPLSVRIGLGPLQDIGLRDPEGREGAARARTLGDRSPL